MHGSFSETMAAAKAVAVEARGRGQFVGKSAPGWTIKRPMEAEPGSWARAVAEALHGYREACSQAQHDYDWATRLEFIFIDGVGHVPF